jgi:hypothetical protein
MLPGEYKKRRKNIMSNKSNDILSGMDAICLYVHRSAPTVLQWIRSRNFPAAQLNQRTWTSSKAMIDEWNKHQIKVDLGLVKQMFEYETRPEKQEIKTPEIDQNLITREIVKRKKEKRFKK